MLHGTGLITTDNFFFLAWGWKNYKKNLLVLKYYPSKRGDRVLNGVNLQKVPTPLYNFNKCIKTMKSLSSHYIKYSPFYARETIEIPSKKLKIVFKPRKRALQILKSPKDPLEKEFVRVHKFLRNYTDVDIGLTASLLFNLHKPNSDIDLIFYGDLNVIEEVKHLLKDLIDEGLLESRINNNEMEILTSMFDDEIHIEKTISDWVHSFSLKNSNVEIHTLSVPDQEIVFDGNVIDSKKQVITGRIIDASYSVYNPALFRIKTSFGEFECICYNKSGNFVKDGDNFEARGTLTRIEKNGKTKYYFLLLDQKEDYLKIR